MRDAERACRDDVARPDARAEPERRVVREPHRLVLVVERLDGHDRPEDLLVLDAARPDRRPRAPSARRTSRASPMSRAARAGQRLGAALERLRDEILDLRRAAARRSAGRDRCRVARRGRSAARAPARRARRRTRVQIARDVDPLDADAHLAAVRERPQSAPSTARSRSASSRTSIGSLPPSSSVTGRSSSPAAAAIWRPVSTEPVKKTFAMPGRLRRAPRPSRRRPARRRRGPAARRPRRTRARPTRPRAASAPTASARRRCRPRRAVAAWRQRNREREVPRRDDGDDAERLVDERARLCARYGIAVADPLRREHALDVRREPRELLDAEQSSVVYASTSGLPVSAVTVAAISSCARRGPRATRSSSARRSSNDDLAHDACAAAAPAATVRDVLGRHRHDADRLERRRVDRPELPLDARGCSHGETVVASASRACSCASIHAARSCSRTHDANRRRAARAARPRASRAPDGSPPPARRRRTGSPRAPSRRAPRARRRSPRG